MFDLEADMDVSDFAEPDTRNHVSDKAIFFSVKRAVDIIFCLLLAPAVLVVAVLLLILNPFGNPGPLLFTQRRMGRNCEPFTAFKFRTMRVAPAIARSADCPLEVDRITPLGRILRKSRIDELPQILNVLRGDMSLIGPRPDYYDHAVHFAREIPGYRQRHVVRPGISGLAQTELGYIEGTEATRRKVRADLFYIRNAGFALEAYVFLKTLSVVLRRSGA